MNLDHSAPGHDDPHASAAGGHAPGKRARTERLAGHRPGHAPAAAGADHEAGAGADADHDDPFFFAEGGRAFYRDRLVPLLDRIGADTDALLASWPVRQPLDGRTAFTMTFGTMKRLIPLVPSGPSGSRASTR